MKGRHARMSAPRTIMSKKEKKTPAFMKPRKHIFKRKEYRRARGAKIFGLTTSTGDQLICHVPSRLCRRAVIVTLDLSANNLHLLKEDHWLSNPKNVLVLRVDEPAWTTGEATGPAETNDMATWAVAELGRWLEAHDMAGPATHFRSQGVNGGDFSGFHDFDLLAPTSGPATNSGDISVVRAYTTVVRTYKTCV